MSTAVNLGEDSDSQMPLRIAYVWDTVLPTQRTEAEQAINTICALARRGHCITVFVPHGRGRTVPTPADLHRQYQCEGHFEIQASQTPLARFMLARKVLFARKVTSLASLRSHDVVYTRNIGLFLLATRRGFPSVLDTYIAWPKQAPAIRPVLQAAMSQPNFTVAFLHSEYARKAYVEAGISPHKLVLMRNGFDSQRYESPYDVTEIRKSLGLPIDKPIAVYTGHVNLLKGAFSLLQVARRCPEILFVIAGVTRRNIIQVCGDRIENVKVVEWLPPSEVVRYQRAADVLLIPPSSVPLRVAGHTILPMKIYSYSAAGKPILAPSTPDMEELLQHGHNAYLVKPGDIEGAAHGLRSIVKNNQLRSTLSQGARKIAEGLTWDTRAHSIERELCARIRGRVS